MKLFAKLIDTNENNNRKITVLAKMVEITKEVRGVGKRGEKNNIAEPPSAAERNTHCQTESKAVSPSAGRVKLYSEVVEGRMAQKVYKLTVTCRENQTAENIKEMLKTQLNPTKIKVGIESVKHLRDGRVQIEKDRVQEAETLTSCIRGKLGDKIETHIQRPRIPRLKIINILEEISTGNIEDTIMTETLKYT